MHIIAYPKWDIIINDIIHFIVWNPLNFFEKTYQNRCINKYHLISHRLIIVIVAEFYLPL